MFFVVLKIPIKIVYLHYTSILNSWISKKLYSIRYTLKCYQYRILRTIITNNFSSVFVKCVMKTETSLYTLPTLSLYIL